jgi:hypothetical protein
MKRFRVLAGVLAVFGALTLSGCASESAAPVKEKADSPGEVVESESGTDEGSDGDVGKQATAQLGDLVTVGDWDVKVTRVVANSNDVIAKANEFNEKPRGQFVLVTYEATYTGSERTADTFADLTWSFTGPNAQVKEPSSQVTPADTEEWPTTARTNGKVRGQVVFDVAPAQLVEALVTVEAYDAEFDMVYADFALA